MEFPKEVYGVVEKISDDDQESVRVYPDKNTAIDKAERWGNGKIGVYRLLEEKAAVVTRALISLLLLVFAVGCSGGKKYMSWPMESEINGTVYHYHNAVQLDLPADLFHDVKSWSHTEVCKIRLENPVTQDEHMYPFQDCKMTSIPQMVPLASVAQQIVTPVAVAATEAAGWVGAGYFVGNGLSKSGTQVHQNSNGNGNAKSGSSSESGITSNSGNTTTNVKPTTNINSNNVFKK